MIVAGSNFGCGSAMEQAAQVIRAAEVPVVLAKSYSRMFYRNAINNGIYLLECDTDGIAEGDDLDVEFANDKTIVNLDGDGAQITASPARFGTYWRKAG